ncbi:MAG: hypothetical protein COZ34_03080 [Candidatus Pacebacteria bacterium CG_4_10_14_3_um_filter_34_15]|nr:hypothetical protein [Candidatus Pacearchaeota archaeon]NCQ66018.1 hypothetical protein [Candidatus Paceibacterota bacterium]OIO43660.1 MAG: hypothetical protein AUJ41_04800 [Candidatus Pacebacteria bacterium CG1_02_43_31]PIQ80920.1 MAG: hypothetical protein COV78_02945 [Candidatus Pacebacteria bacterium CG11_big_fil_rev_8_21_14_0_20_34_55]PIX81434.1 MAG: hypothetical protein COZ34_03080 [Candidatus Pacebacteria bacterium CG_4_10_14_3_um_filter_34_15]PJC43619.1 MAG: hypothetical protein CO0
MFFKTKLLIFLIILTSTGATLYYFGDRKKINEITQQTLEETPLKNLVERANNFDKNKINFDLDSMVQGVEQEFSQLSTHTEEVKKHADNILGATKSLESPFDATADSTPIYEKTFEYGKYVYCKQVVEDYEEFNK